MKTKHFFLATLSILLGIGLSIYVVINIKSFSNGPEALGLIGQYDETGYPNPNPLYTSNRQNNLPNLFSLTGSYGQVIDSVNHRLFVSDTGNNRILVFDLTAGDLLVDHVPDGVLGQANFYSNSASITASGVDQPSGLAYHSVDNLLFVADSYNNRVLVFDVASISNGEDAINVLGQGDFVSNASATTQSGLNGPRDLTLDSTNDLLFVSDVNNNRIAVFDVSSIDNGENMVNAVGQYNEADYSAVAPLYTSSRVDNSPNRLGLNTPSDMATYENYSDGKLFVSDAGNNRVLVYNLAIHHNFWSPDDHIPDYVLGQPDFHSNSSGTTINTFSAPTKLAVDNANGRLFVTDSGNTRVLIFDFSGGITDGMDASYVLGQTDFTSSNAGTSDALFSGPQGLEYNSDSNLLYLADSYNNRVLVFDVSTITNGESAINVLGQTDFVSSSGGNTAGTMNYPSGVSFESEHNRLFVADTGNNRVLVFDLTATTDGEDAVNVFGQANFTNNGSALSQSGMNGPQDVAYFDDNIEERLYVSDSNNSRVLVFNVDAISDGENATFVVGQENFTSSNQVNDADGMSNPQGIHINSFEDPHLWVADSGFHRITNYQPNDIVENGIVAYEINGQFDETDLSNPQPILTTQRINNAPNMLGLNSPYGMALDTTDHRLFISDSNNNRILGFDLDATNVLVDYQPDYVLGQANFYSNSTATTIDGLTSPQGIVFDDDNDRLFVVDSLNNRIMVFDVAVISNGENAVKVLGQTDFVSSSGNTAQSTVSSPYSVAYDNTNDYLYVGDINNNRVMTFNVASIDNGENAVDLIGKYDQTNLIDPVPLYTISSDAPNRIGLNTSLGQVIDSVHHRLFISDSENHRVLIYELDSNNLLVDRIPDNVLGQENFYEAIPEANQDSMQYPMGLAYDSILDRLFVTERDSNRISVFDTTTITNGEDAINVLGQPNFTTSSPLTSISKLHGPHFIAFDQDANRLFVGDTHNRRVEVFDVATITNGEDAVNVIGQDTFNTSLIATTQNRFNLVTGVAYDSTNHRLFVGDYNNHRVMVFDVATITNGENAINVLGQANFTSAVASLTQNGFQTRVFGIAYDNVNQRLFATDTDANRVLTFDVASIIDGEDAVNVIGQGDFTSNNSGTSRSAIASPLSLAFDETNNRLFLGEFNSNNRVMVFDVSETVGGGGGGGGQQPGINVVHTGDGTFVSENSTDTFTISLKSNITSDVVLSITSSNTNEGTVFPATITFSNNNWNTPQTITLTGISDGVVDGNQSYNIIISVIDELSATSYDGVADVIFSVSTTDSDTTKEDDKKTDDKTGDDKKTDDKTGDDKKDDDKKTDDKTGDDKKTDDKTGDGSGDDNDKNSDTNSDESIFTTIFKIISDILGNVITKTLVILGATTSIGLNLLRTVFSNPLGLTDLAMRAWSMFLYGFGIKKRHKPWGVVFDSQTKQPLDPVYLKLVDIEKKTLATCFTDIDGRYGFLVEPGHYHIIAEKTHYVFPSSKLNSKERDEVYTDLYYGNYIEIKEFGEVISKNIPMDRVGFDWNEYAKLEQHRLRWYKRSDKAVGQIIDVFFLVGFIMSGITLLGNDVKPYNVIIFAFYGILFAFNHTQFGNNAKGKAIFKEGSPIAYGILRVFSKQSGTEITHKIIDRLGNYFCLAPNGNYNISIEQKNADGSYTKVHSEENIQVNKGYLKKDFKV